jgi:hypothetical protein
MLEGAEPFDVNREVAIQEQADEARNLTRLGQDTDLLSLMNTVQGRRFMWRLLDLAGVFRLSYAGEATHATAFAEGGRQIGNVLLADIHRLCPVKYQLMVSEQQTRD